ncbi:MAG: DUF255 domain-containing protein [Epsilonproteobacteria bacterium]|nr:DUF255 domain-containing protein [Campylobacterota bacterium]
MRLFLFVTLLMGSLYANHVRYTTNYDLALKHGINKDKIVIVMIALRGCPVCEFMTDRVFENKEIVNYLHTHYITVIKYLHRDKIPKRFKTEHTPTFFFIDPHTQKPIRKRKFGGSTEEKFLEVIQDVKELYDSQRLHNQLDTIDAQEINSTKGTL